MVEYSPGGKYRERFYGLSICEERVALFKAVSEGKREFIELAELLPDVFGAGEKT